MSFVCLSSPAWPTDAARSTELARRSLLLAPRIRFEPARGVLWADARGLDPIIVAAGLAELASALGADQPRAGVAATPIGALVAARTGTEPITVVPPGSDRAFLAPLDLGHLDPPPPRYLYPLLAGIGIENCGDLARLDAQSVEVRFGAEGIRLWQLARGDDRRPIFGARLRDLPSAELEWVEYELADQEQVTFIVNSLLATVTDQLSRRREGAHGMVLEFGLADRSRIELPIRASHPTADRKIWLRVIRVALEPVTFSAPAMRIGLRVDAAAPLADRQGDLFDTGFSTERATEAALAHLLDKQADAIVVAESSLHPLPERRTAWRTDTIGRFTPRILPGGEAVDARAPRLGVQLFPVPRSIHVWSVMRRGVPVPDRYYDGTQNYRLSASLGPDRISGGFDEAEYNRDYFQGVRHDGVMVLLYRDRLTDGWFLAGWWD